MNQSFEQQRLRLLQQFEHLETYTAVQLDAFTLSLFRFQYKYNQIYRQYCNYLGMDGNKLSDINKIPFLPISAFKHHDVKTGEFTPQAIFRSSGTTNSTTSIHNVRDILIYLKNTEKIWSYHFNDVKNYCFLALLPGYLEREGSSLIYMVQHFIADSKYGFGGFYLRNHDELLDKLSHCNENKIPTVLFGVTYGLLDFAEKFKISFPELIVMETGGMKGQRNEITKAELHHILQEAFDVPFIYSEYGMTELLSQTYTKGGSTFYCHPRLHISIHQSHDPLTVEKNGKAGIISIIDFANIDSCAFIQTEDLGIKYDTNSFEILGRLDYADIRGCNLLVQESGLV